MLRSLRIAIALIRIPRLFGNLLLVPLLMSLVFIGAQIFFSTVLVEVLAREREKPGEKNTAADRRNIVNQIVFGKSEHPTSLTICRWHDEIVGGKTIEVPPSPECDPNRLDVALQVDDPQSFDPTTYADIFRGNTERLHLCKTCAPDVVIRNPGPHATTEIHSVWGMLLVNSVSFDDHVAEAFRKAREMKINLQNLLGEQQYFAQGLREPVSIHGLEIAVVMALNLASILVAALWLALKAHRRVLDYFSKNGALLPMVASTGKDAFYGAIWCITLLRVSVFLIATVPLAYLSVSSLLEDHKLLKVPTPELGDASLWLLSLSVGLMLATLIASISDLKQRQQLLSIAYRFVPLLMAFSGGLIWTSSFLFEGAFSGILRNVIVAIPVVGLCPVVLAPIFKPDLGAMLLHAILTTSLLVITMRKNAAWFAAHLEEL